MDITMVSAELYMYTHQPIFNWKLSCVTLEWLRLASFPPIPQVCVVPLVRVTSRLRLVG